MEKPTERESYDVNQIRRDLQTTRFAHPLEYRERVTSTNDRIVDMALRGAPEGTVALAEEQTAGRGRRGHGWHSPPGVGIWTSFLLRPRIAGYHLPALTLCAAYTLVQVIEETTGAPVNVKWPNDLLIENRKVAGILGEAKTMPREGPCVVIGIGINVSQEATQFPLELQKTATSLRLVTGKRISRDLVFCRLVSVFETVYQQFLRDGLAPFLPVLSERLAWRGRLVEVSDMNRGQTGSILDIQEDGSLAIETEDKTRLCINSGSLRLLA